LAQVRRRLSSRHVCLAPVVPSPLVRSMAFVSCGYALYLFKVGLFKVSQFFFPFVLESLFVLKAVCRALARLTLLCPSRRSLPDGGGQAAVQCHCL